MKYLMARCKIRDSTGRMCKNLGSIPWYWKNRKKKEKKEGLERWLSGQEWLAALPKVLSSVFCFFFFFFFFFFFYNQKFNNKDTISNMVKYTQLSPELKKNVSSSTVQSDNFVQNIQKINRKYRSTKIKKIFKENL